MTESRHFTCFGKIGEIISMVPEEQGMELAYALVMYGTLGREHAFDDPMTGALFASLRDDVDHSLCKIEQGKRGGRPPKGEPKAAPVETMVSENQKPWFPETENHGFEDCKTMVSEEQKPWFPENGENEKPKTRQDKTGYIDVSSETSDMKSPADDGVPYSEIVSALNEAAGTSYKPTSKKTRSLILARWREGFRLADFEAVVASRCAEWRGDPKMCRYLRPETLFGAKFEGYLQAASLAGGARENSLGSFKPDYSGEGW